MQLFYTSVVYEGKCIYLCSSKLHYRHLADALIQSAISKFYVMRYCLFPPIGPIVAFIKILRVIVLYSILCI
uniref:Uncharacterized protein n=1 Tax=Anguilla anguilla TaxID=7936 RepID=A0A0E9WZ24_ANGAN